MGNITFVEIIGIGNDRKRVKLNIAKNEKFIKLQNLDPNFRLIIGAINPMGDPFNGGDITWLYPGYEITLMVNNDSVLSAQKARHDFGLLCCGGIVNSDYNIVPISPGQASAGLQTGIMFPGQNISGGYLFLNSTSGTIRYANAGGGLSKPYTFYVYYLKGPHADQTITFTTLTKLVWDGTKWLHLFTNVNYQY